MKKQTVEERYVQQNLFQHQAGMTGSNELQQVFTQIGKSISQARQAAMQIQAANPQQKQTNRLTNNLDFAILQLQQLNTCFHESILGLNASTKQQLQQLENELAQSEQTLNFIKSSL